MLGTAPAKQKLEEGCWPESCSGCSEKKNPSLRLRTQAVAPHQQKLRGRSPQAGSKGHTSTSHVHSAMCCELSPPSAHVHLLQCCFLFHPIHTEAHGYALVQETNNNSNTYTSSNTWRCNSSIYTTSTPPAARDR